MNQHSLIVSLILAMSLGTINGQAAQPSAVAATPQIAGGNPLREAYYGDLHLHTGYSFDAYVLFGTRVTPEEAYRFARGEPVSYMGQVIRRKDPLDFLAITDHAENIGIPGELENPDSALYNSDLGRKVRSEGAKAFWELTKFLKQGAAILGLDMAAANKSAWQREIDAANRNYQPGKFTTFIAYEWTSTPNRANLHRNVIFQGSSAPPPFTALDSRKPEDLWNYLEANRAVGNEALAIPHNANVSNGLMYDWVDSAGKPIDQAYAQRRVVNEPLSEISQNKGTSETHPALSSNDEMANFELFEYLLGTTTKGAVAGSYIREAYGRGLVLQEKAGANPYKFGVVGASDIHTGLDISREADYSGSGGIYKPTVDQLKENLAPVNPGLEDTVPGIVTSPGSLTGVWAEENTRESIYAALRRKETFATSGTRLKFRFFGGWNYARSVVNTEHWVESAYAHGVPMGGDLPAMPSTAKAPQFVVWALKDPNGANLDRAQIIKVWLKNGKHEEKVFDVAYAGKRRPDPATGKLQPVGNTVDLKNATYRNSIGATNLHTVWTDPEFDAKLPAVYYLRVIEIPTPRWSTIMAVKHGLALPTDAPASIQERGWSSPIWYAPAKAP